MRQRYNRWMDSVYDNIRDFISLHYYAANRDEPFWLAARAPTVPSDRLAENFELWRYRLPDAQDIPQGSLFSHPSYALCLAAKGFFRGRKMALQPVADGRQWKAYSKVVYDAKAAARRLPSVREFLSTVRGEAGPAKEMHAEPTMMGRPAA